MPVYKQRQHLYSYCSLAWHISNTFLYLRYDAIWFRFEPDNFNIRYNGVVGSKENLFYNYFLKRYKMKIWVKSLFSFSLYLYAWFIVSHSYQEYKGIISKDLIKTWLVVWKYIDSFPYIESIKQTNFIIRCIFYATFGLG